VLTRAEVRTLLSSVRVSRFRAILSLISHCGLRVGEACRIEVTHIDAKRRVLRILNAKGGSRGPWRGAETDSRRSRLP
jgi:integrase